MTAYVIQPGWGHLIPDDVLDGPVILPHMLQADAWFRRAAFCLTYPELLREGERQVLSVALFDLAPSDEEVALIETTFRKSARLAAGWHK
jgi:hypothetical protein